jgi:lipopolysaccharide biosynthesis regulator YciM
MKVNRRSTLLAAAYSLIGSTPLLAQREPLADAKLSHMISTFNAAATSKSAKQEYERAIAEAQKLKNDHKDSPAARIAQYYIALSEEKLGHTDKAIQSFEELIQTNDATMKPLAQFALALLYKHRGDNGKALEIYKQLDESAVYVNHSGNHASPDPKTDHH